MTQDHPQMRWSVALSQRQSVPEALDELMAGLAFELGTDAPDLLVLFTVGHSPDACELICDALVQAYPRATLVGMTTSGALAGAREYEDGPMVSLTAACLPGVAVEPFFHVPGDQVGRGKGRSFTGQIPPAEEQPLLLLFGEPFGFQPNAFLEALAESHPGCPVIGGLASGSVVRGRNRLFLNGELRTEGAVGVALTGNLEWQAVLSPGGRPVGEPLVVTEGDGKLVLGLADSPALDVLAEIAGQVHDESGEVDQDVFLGRVIEDLQRAPGPGDFVLHSVIEIDQELRGFAVAGAVDVGARVQFHVLDGQTASDDLERVLEPAKARGAWAGGLLISCVERGTRLYGQAHRDAEAIHASLGHMPLGGCFARGEIGPVGPRSFLQAFSASVVLIRPKSS